MLCSKSCLEEHLSTKDFILAGAKWRTGNRESVKIWGDNWLPDNVGFKVPSATYCLNKDVLVCSLIDQDHLLWKKRFLNNCFDPVDAI